MGKCPREDCQLCRRDEIKQSICCWKAGSGYCIDCVRDPCVDESPGGTKTYRSRYQGETARTGYTRLKQHYSTYGRETQKAIKDSWMWEHTLEDHRGVRGPNNGETDYIPKITGTF